MNILIVGTGPSVGKRTLKFGPDYRIIAVNQAVRLFGERDKNPDVWFTLDPSSRNIDVMQKYPKVMPDCRFICACSEDTVLPESVFRIKRLSKPPLRNIFRSVPQTPREWLERWGSVETLSEKPGEVHTGNSIWGALQLAFWERPKKIAILGLDGTKGKSVGTGHTPNNLTHLPLLFESSLDQLKRENIEVLNGSPFSNVDCFDKSTPDDAIEWINK